MLALLVKAAASLSLLVLCACVKKRVRRNEKLWGGKKNKIMKALHQNCSVLLTRM